MMIDKSEELYLQNTTITRNIRGDVDSTEYKSSQEFTMESALGRRKVAFLLYCLIFFTWRSRYTAANKARKYSPTIAQFPPD
jgi:hypothetical protein